MVENLLWPARVICLVKYKNLFSLCKMETSLPIDLIEIIMSCENLSINDVLNFSLTNSYYFNVVRDLNTMWKKKYFQTWPDFFKLFEKKNFEFCWYEEIQYIYDLKRRTREMLSEMSLRLYKCYQLVGSDFTQWIEICDENPRTCNYLIHDLMNIVNTDVAINSIEAVPITTPGTITMQYYALKVLTFLLQLRLTEEWLTYVALSPRQRTIEKGAVLVMQCCRPIICVSWKDFIPKHLDTLAEKVKEHLKAIDPNHPLLSVPEEELKRWRNENIEGNKYSAKHCRKVVQALERVFGFNPEYFNFGGNNSDLLKNNTLFEPFLAIDIIEVCGARKSLLLIYESVARRLGLKYEVIHASKEVGAFNLRISEVCYNAKENMTQNNQLSVSATDAFVECLVNDPTEFCSDSISHKRCVQCEQMRPNLQRLQLLQFLTPVIKSPVTFMMKCYLDHTMDSVSFLHSLLEQRIFDLDLVRSMIKSEIKEQACRNGRDMFKKTIHAVRPPNLKYAVGMLVRYRKNTCVICDWKMVSTISGKKPVYNVLFRAGYSRVVAQDELKLYSGRNLYFSVDVGMHFSHAFKTHFVPNAEKEKEYPADTAIRWKFYEKSHEANS